MWANRVSNVNFKRIGTTNMMSICSSAWVISAGGNKWPHKSWLYDHFALAVIAKTLWGTVLKIVPYIKSQFPNMRSHKEKFESASSAPRSDQWDASSRVLSYYVITNSSMQQRRHQSCRKAARSAQGCGHLAMETRCSINELVHAGVSKWQQKYRSAVLLKAKSKVKKAVNDFVTTVAHLTSLQITWIHGSKAR